MCSQSLVEQATAASQAMATQAGELNELMSRYQIEATQRQAVPGITELSVAA